MVGVNPSRRYNQLGRGRAEKLPKMHFHADLAELGVSEELIAGVVSEELRVSFANTLILSGAAAVMWPHRFRLF